MKKSYHNAKQNPGQSDVDAFLHAANPKVPATPQLQVDKNDGQATTGQAQADVLQDDAMSTASSLACLNGDGALALGAGHNGQARSVPGSAAAVYQEINERIDGLERLLTSKIQSLDAQSMATTTMLDRIELKVCS
jgi:hypothetical protein